MGAITDVDDLVTLVTGGNNGTPQSIFFTKEGRTVDGVTATQSKWSSYWQNFGNPSHGSPPGAVAAPDNTTAGSLRQVGPGGGRQQWLLNLSVHTLDPSAFLLYDRLLHISGFDGTSTANQTVGGSLTRYTNGIGNQIWIEIYAQIGSTTTTIAAVYTNQDGNSATTPLAAIGGLGLRENRRLIPLPLASGDTGVQGVTRINLTASTGTAGDFGVTVAHPLALVGAGSFDLGNITIVGWGNRDLIGATPEMTGYAGAPGIVEIASGACLSFATHHRTGLGGVRVAGAIHMVER